MTGNPYTLSFGIEPSQVISRYSQTQEIIDAFSQEVPSNYVYVISGVRGSGKTVMLTSLSTHFGEIKDWIVINVTPESDMLNALAAKLYSRTELKKLFVNAKLDLSAFGLGVSLSGADQIFDMGTALERMLAEIRKKGRRVLVCVDEVANNEHVRLFTSEYQILLREKLPVFLLMTGLYENVNNLQNEKTLTFLYRAPKMMLAPLSIGAISRSYADTLKIDKDRAMKMAKMTKGYPFAYQVLGYLYWQEFVENKREGDPDELLPQFDDMLENFVYEKLWYELSPKEQDIIAYVAGTDEAGVIDVRQALGLSSGSMSVYRDRLKRKGLIDTSRYGKVSLMLPRFGEIISAWVD
ncbi:MAG: ATP-binding protein [Lachnospiraceae bacterium]|nr:ATP-binding protein [Lachnospiraceae bacterium]